MFVAFGFSSGAYEKIAEGLYRIRFDQGFANAHFASGLEKLAFEVIYCLFTTEGSIPSDPTFGTRMREFVGQLNMGADESVVTSLIMAEVVKAENQVKSRQATASLPASEKLKTLVVDMITIERSTQSVSINLIIVNELNQSVGFEIPLTGASV